MLPYFYLKNLDLTVIRKNVNNENETVKILSSTEKMFRKYPNTFTSFEDLQTL